jgi:CubicO group peptidase (beta-lactamase class C family)
MGRRSLAPARTRRFSRARRRALCAAALCAAGSLGAALLGAPQARAQQEQKYDYWRFNRELIARGQQAMFTCNGLFTSGRTLEQIYAQELKFLRAPLPAAEVQIDRERRAVAVGTDGYVPTVRAAYREGIGCVSLAPDQGLGDIDTLPVLNTPPAPGDPEQLAWPDGDRLEASGPPAGVDAAALQAASDGAFQRESPEQITTSLLIVHRGQIVHERYAPGFDASTRTRTWSTAKSITATLIGMLVEQGKLSLDAPLELDWKPELRGGRDPRAAITLRHLLQMSSGLEPVDNGGLEYATGSGLGYWVGASSLQGALARPLVREPGTYWDYENYDTLLAVYAMKKALGSSQAYLEFPRKALFDRIGMRSTLVGTDRFGDFILSSQVFTHARDLARFGLLYLQNGMWKGERLLSEDWIRFVRTPAPATAERGREYGGQWWLVPDTRSDVPKDAYSTNGNRGQFVVVVPTHQLVIVRQGLDYGRQGFDRWSLTREVLKAIAPTPGG